MKSPLALPIVIIALLIHGAHAQTTKEGFLIPQTNAELTFPRDHGSHPNFKIEWWYLTGHLFNESKARYGFQATFFRLAQRAPKANQEAVNFGADQLYMAHMAVVDVSSKRYHHEERLNRNGWDASSRSGDLGLRNGNWTLARAEDDSINLSGSIRADAQIDLTLTPTKPLVRFGKDGVSRKSADATASSYYLTFTRLATTGTLRIDGKDHQVHGQAWMDHEISSGQLSRDQIGWDWVSMQLNDGREIMAFILRTATGEPDPFSCLTWITQEGDTIHVPQDGFTWDYQGDWTSPTSKATYPIAPIIRVSDPNTGKAVTYTLRPVMKEQELIGRLTGIAYWEGACDVLNAKGDAIGQAYLELTGYAQGLANYLGADNR